MENSKESKGKSSRDFGGHLVLGNSSYFQALFERKYHKEK